MDSLGFAGLLLFDTVRFGGVSLDVIGPIGKLDRVASSLRYGGGGGSRRRIISQTHSELQHQVSSRLRVICFF